MIIQCDTRQKRKHHDAKEAYFVSQGAKLVHSKMLVGDYCVPSDGSICVDTKADVSELYGNLIQQHERFRSECMLAQEAGINLYIVIENKYGFVTPQDIIDWKNPQYFRYLKAKRNGSKQKPPATNATLVKIMHSMTRDYGVKFIFCSPEESGRIVMELLKVETPCDKQKET